MLIWKQIKCIQINDGHTLSMVLKNWSITSHFSLVSSTCLLLNGSRIRNFTSSLPPNVFLPSVICQSQKIKKHISIIMVNNFKLHWSSSDKFYFKSLYFQNKAWKSMTNALMFSIFTNTSKTMNLTKCIDFSVQCKILYYEKIA